MTGGVGSDAGTAQRSISKGASVPSDARTRSFSSSNRTRVATAISHRRCDRRAGLTVWTSHGDNEARPLHRDGGRHRV